MGWKSTKEISRKELEKKIEHEILYNIENLSDETLTYVLEILSEDKKSNIGSGYNYTVKNEAQIQPSCLGAVSFSIFDKVYMDSPFGRYTGIVKDVKDGKMTIESHSPTGNGTMWADYDIEGTDWQKY